MRYLLAVLLILLTVYVGAGMLIRTSARVQRFIIFQHRIRTPWFANFSNPAEFGLRNTRQVVLAHERGGCAVPVWHVLPRSYLDQEGSDIPAERYDLLLADGAPIVLYLHGNTGSRALWHRVQLYKFLAEEKGYHVIAFDYRGFAESDCQPSERGMMEDGRLVWRWIEQRAAASRVFVWGHSLGSAAATYLAKELRASSAEPAGLILDAPFTTIADAASGHPLAVPYRPIMRLFRYLVFDTFSERFESVKRLEGISCPLLILHGRRDPIIPFEQGWEMYQTALKSRRNVPGAKGVEFVDCGDKTHKNNYESPQTSAALDRFI